MNSVNVCRGEKLIVENKKRGSYHFIVVLMIIFSLPIKTNLNKLRPLNTVYYYVARHYSSSVTN